MDELEIVLGVVGLVGASFGVVLPLLSRLNDIVNNQKIMADQLRITDLKVDAVLATAGANANRLRQIKQTIRVPDTDSVNILPEDQSPPGKRYRTLSIKHPSSPEFEPQSSYRDQ